MDDPVLDEGLLIFGFLAIVLAPMALDLASTRLGGAGWKLLTFLCCSFAWWYFFFGSGLLIVIVAWALAWACAMMAFRVRFFNPTPCVIRDLLRKDEARRIAVNFAKLPEPIASECQ